MNPDPRILESVAHFNSRHDYSFDAILTFVNVAIRHAHQVQLARVKAEDPQLELPIEV